MLFNSLHFFFFFVAAIAMYFTLPTKHRWWWLLIASCYFYMAFIPSYILILFAVILIDYIAAIFIHRSQKKSAQKIFLLCSIIANVGILAFFKYTNFFSAQLNLLFHSSAFKGIEWVLPIGLSFHTFQAMSYTIEVYRGNYKPEKHLGIYTLYVLFYPQLVAGPIERPQNLLPQFKKFPTVNYDDIKSGLWMMATGLFKKVVIADRLSILVDGVFNNVGNATAFEMVIAVVFFSIQIYCDFSGYSSIALGCARVMGFKLMTNFNKPYLSVSVTEFWRRWHISLSSWFRDYVYIPMGGSRGNAFKAYFNLIVVFLISGFWHGANYTFMVWGFAHGILVALERFAKSTFSNFVVPKWLGWLYTFIATSLIWIFFRSPDIATTQAIFNKIFVGRYEVLNSRFILSRQEMIFCGLLIIGLLLHEKIANYNIILSKKYWVVLLLMIATIFLFGIFNQKQFIYFQF